MGDSARARASIRAPCGASSHQSHGSSVSQTWRARWWTSGLACMCALVAATVGAVARANSPGRIEVSVGDNFYRPNVIRVRPDAEIVFTNTGRQLHAMTLIGHERDLDEAYVRPGKT